MKHNNFLKLANRHIIATFTALAVLSTPVLAEEIIASDEVTIDSVTMEEPIATIDSEGIAILMSTAGTVGNQKLEINQGLSTLTQLDTGTSKQLTPRLIAKDGGIAADGTVYIQYDVTNTLWAYNYSIQGSNGDLVPIVTTQYPNSSGDTSVTSLTFSDGKVTGYSATNAGTSNLFSLDEFRARMEVVTGSGSGSGGSEELIDPNKDNPSVENPASNVKPGTIRMVDGKIIYTEDINGVATDSTIKIVGTIDTYGVDKYGTYAVRITDGYLYLFNPDVSVTPYLYSKKCTGLIIENDRVTGYKLTGGDVPVLELKVLTSLYLHQWRCVADSSNWYEKLIDPNGNEIIRTLHKSNTIRYYRKNALTDEWNKKHCKKVGGIRQAGFGTDGTWYVIKRDGRLYTIDQQTYKLTKNKELKNLRSFIYSTNGTVLYAVDKKENIYPLF